MIMNLAAGTLSTKTSAGTDRYKCRMRSGYVCSNNPKWGEKKKEAEWNKTPQQANTYLDNFARNNTKEGYRQETPITVSENQY